jgi:hypothetical protein
MLLAAILWTDIPRIGTTTQFNPEAVKPWIRHDKRP